MEIVLIKTLQVILALSVLILIHEAGHFTFAKIFKIKVDKFFLFFDAGGFKLLSTKSGWFSKLFPQLKNYETEYGIGWLPLGGYCKINGMIDESFDMETMRQEPKPWEFRSKSAWKRMLVMSGGVLYNFIFAIIMFICILGIWDKSYISNNDAHIYASELAQEMGFRTGDKILKMDNHVPEDFGMLQAYIVRKSVHKVTVLRDKDTIDIYIDQAMTPQILNTPDLFSLAVPFIIDTIPPQSPNYGKGFVKGDRIVEINGNAIKYVQDSRKILKNHSNEIIASKIIRGADTLNMQLAVDSLGMAMIFAHIPGIVTKDYNAITAIPAGFKMTFSTIGGYLSDLKMVATPSTGAYKSVGSFIAIGQVFPSSWDWYKFLYLLALLSIMLGVMNLLPIPALDGGHIVFTIYEMLTGHKPNDRFLIAAQIVGMALLMALMVLAFGNDIGRLIK